MKSIALKLARSLVLLTTTVVLAQTPAAVQTPAATTTPATIPPPIAPLMTVYTFWPEQFVQWVGNELPYSMVQLNVDDNNGKPIFDFVLTDRATQKRAHHSNVQA